MGASERLSEIEKAAANALTALAAAETAANSVVGRSSVSTDANGWRLIARALIAYTGALATPAEDEAP